MELLTAEINLDSRMSQPLAALAANGAASTVDVTATANAKSLDVFLMMPPSEPKQHRCLQLVSGSIQGAGLRWVGRNRFPGSTSVKNCDFSPDYAKLVAASRGFAG